jgi:N-acetylmuramic acid 6-phosphate etherase
MTMSASSLARARDFIANETQFHLGFLPTEQSSPLTRNLDKEFARSTVDGVANLQLVDRNVLEMAKKVLISREFSRLCAEGLETLKKGRKIVF